MNFKKNILLLSLFVSLNSFAISFDNENLKTKEYKDMPVKYYVAQKDESIKMISDGDYDVYFFFDYKDYKSQKVNGLINIFSKLKNKSNISFFKAPYINDENLIYQRMYYLKNKMGLNETIEDDLFKYVQMGFVFNDKNISDLFYEYGYDPKITQRRIDKYLNNDEFNTFKEKMSLIKDRYDIKQLDIPCMVIIEKDSNEVIKISSFNNADPLSYFSYFAK